MANRSRKEVIKLAKQAIQNAEKWHSKVSVREIVFGFNDGSVSTLALLAGVVGSALARSGVLIAGLSGVIAGAISMAVGAYISSKSEIEHFRSEIAIESEEIKNLSDVEREEVRQLYERKARFSDAELEMIVGRLTKDKATWLDVMLKEELGLFQSRFANPVRVGLTMFGAFIVGGLAPLLPFFFTSTGDAGLIGACIVTFCALFAIGVWKTTFTKRNWVRSGTEMVVIGVIATVVPYIVGDILIQQVLSGLL